MSKTMPSAKQKGHFYSKLDLDLLKLVRIPGIGTKELSYKLKVLVCVLFKRVQREQTQI